MPKKCRFAVCILPCVLTVLGAGIACGQGYPHKPVRFITSFPGGTNDLVARTIAHRLPESLGQPVVIENRGGAVSGEIVARASADGYTLLVAASDLWVTPLLRKAAYAVERDLLPITMAIRQPTLAVVHPSLPIKSVRELIEYAKARPGELNYASATTGSASHTGMELFKLVTGVSLVRVPYKSAGAAATALVGGEVKLTFGTAASVAAHVKSGKLRALAVTSLEPSVLFPDLPTVAATVPGFESVTVCGVFAPAGTPSAVVDRLNRDMVRVLARADVRDQLLTTGVEAVGSSTEDFRVRIKAETARLAKLIKDTRMTAD